MSSYSFKIIENEAEPKKVKQVKDAFGVITNDYVRVGSYFVDSKNEGLIKDYYNDNFYCHPDLSIRFVTEFDDKGYPSVLSYTNNINNILNIEYIHYMRSDSINDDYLVEIACDLSIIPFNFYNECINDGLFYHINVPNKFLPRYPSKYRKVNNAYYYPNDINDINLRSILGLTSATFTTTEGLRNKFGVEIETITGYLPKRVDKFLNYNAVHDGSLKNKEFNNEVWGGEYVTGVLVGDSGFLQLKRLIAELNKRCTINKQCSIHVHVGDINFNKEYIVLLYWLCERLQSELMLTQPISRRNNEYCRLLPIKVMGNIIPTNYENNNDYLDSFIIPNYNKLYELISKEGYDPKRHNKKKQHPMGPKCNYDHSTARYCWLNLVPTLFDTRGDNSHTVEIRLSAASLNYNKIKNWLLLCLAIINFPENHKKVMYDYVKNNKSITIKDILLYTYPKKGILLNDYFEKRKELFNLDRENQSVVEIKDYQDNDQVTELNYKNI